MKKDDQFYVDMQKHIAISAVGPSALRNQGSAGVIKAAQKHLADINLQIFRTKNEGAFLRVLDDQTEVLRRALPRAAQNWGAARKALNLFLRGICYNRFLCEKHGRALVEEWLEIPLDNLTAASLKRKDKKGYLPQWPGLKGLTPDVSSKFQALANQIASSPKTPISRIHLDMRLWAEERERTASNSVHRIADKAGTW